MALNMVLHLKMKIGVMRKIESLVAIHDPGPNKVTSVVASASNSHPPENCITGVTPLSSSSPLPEVPKAVQDDNYFNYMRDLFVVDNGESLLLDGFNNQYEVILSVILLMTHD